jgi:hypothetical protein
MIDELITSLMIWIARTTERPLAAPPAVVLCPLTVLPSLSPLAPHRLAIYDDDGHTVNLARDWNEHDPVDQSVLLHALLHHAQPDSAETDCCHHAREAEAYRLQALWLSQQGIDFRQAFGMSPSLIARLHLCAEMQSRRLELPSRTDVGIRTSRLA